MQRSNEEEEEKTMKMKLKIRKKYFNSNFHQYKKKNSN